MVLVEDWAIVENGWFVLCSSDGRLSYCLLSFFHHVSALEIIDNKDNQLLMHDHNVVMRSYHSTIKRSPSLFPSHSHHYEPYQSFGRMY